MEVDLLSCELQLLGKEQNDKTNSIFLTEDCQIDIQHELIAEMWPEPQTDDFHEYFTTNVDRYLEKDDNIRQVALLIQGVEFLRRFVGENWTGPRKVPDEQESIWLPERSLLKFFGETRSSRTRSLELVDRGLSEDCNVFKVKRPEYLWIAKQLLCTYHDRLPSCISAAWWALRCVNINQQILDEKSSALCDLATKFIEKGITAEPLMTNDEYISVQIQFHLESFQLLLNYHNISKSKEHLNTAQKLAGINILVTGALGKRTRYQQDDKPQLLLKIESCGDKKNLESTFVPQNIFPQNVKSEDGVLLDEIAFQDDTESLSNLTLEEQAIILNHFLLTKKSNASNELITEELQAYLNAVISQPKNWAIQTTALFYRSLLENNHSRTIERAMKQLEVLTENFHKTTPSDKERMLFFYSIPFPPIWLVQLNLAKTLTKLGAISTALEIYLELERWDDVIQCSIFLDRKKQAEMIIREQLNQKETPALWCYLAEATDNPEYFTRAWELSNFHSSQAQKGLGLYFYSKKEYAKCISHLEKSLEINKLQLSVWNALAYAAMQIHDWELTAKAYRHCLNLEPDNFQGWNNLSSAYIKLNQKARAWRTLQEALKCNYDDWHIWENYIVVSTDCGAFEEVLTAYHRILDLKNKHLDLEILGILVRAIVNKIPDINGVSAEGLLNKALELFGRLTAQVTNNSRLWILYAELAKLKKDDEVTNTSDKVLQLTQRAYKCATQKHNWEKDIETREEVINLTKQLTDVY